MAVGFGSHPDINLSHLKFLVVDDKIAARGTVLAALAECAAVRQAFSVEEAIDVLSEDGGALDGIIAEWDMLPLGGLELLRMIRCRTMRSVSPRIPFIILTAHATEVALKCALDLDVNGIAVAPLSREKFDRTLTAALTQTWFLQDIAHYAAVPGIVSPPRSRHGSRSATGLRGPKFAEARNITTPLTTQTSRGRSTGRWSSPA
jgi:CheY-like chemotaxis protein